MSADLSVEDAIVAAIRRVIRAVDLHSRRLAEDCGLTGPQLAVLQETERLGPASAGAIARAVHLSSATVSGILDRLVRRGLIERERCARDRRSLVLRATSEGRGVLQAAPSLLQDRFRRELTRLEEWERTQILATLQRIAAMMEAEHIEASPVLVTGTLSASAGEVREPNEPGVASMGERGEAAAEAERP